MLIIALTSFGAEYGKNGKKIKNIDLSVALGLKYDSYDNGDDSILTKLKV